MRVFLVLADDPVLLQGGPLLHTPADVGVPGLVRAVVRTRFLCGAVPR